MFGPGRDTLIPVGVAIIGVLVVGTLATHYLSTGNETVTSTVTTNFMAKGTANLTLLSVGLVNSTLGSRLVLNVTFKNTGNLLDYYYVGGASSIRFAVSPANSVQLVSISTPCAGGAFTVALEPGETTHVLSGSCGDTAYYRLAHKGPIAISMYFDWESAGVNLTLHSTPATVNFTVT
ncbi:MAG TPA: hypothetical protein VGR56_04325 [Nitrososphaerales archaeon]|nr:hypothetical protein [Nitrososphaerales archaeon]